MPTGRNGQWHNHQPEKGHKTMSEPVSEVTPETVTQVTETEPDYKAEAEKWKVPLA